MNDLDDKLRDIIDTARDDPADIYDEQFVSQLKQAFADAGYVDSKLAHHQVRMLNDKGYMTGQEWYDRFVKEFEKPFKRTFTAAEQKRANELGKEQIVCDWAYAAAQRAAGIDTTTELSQQLSKTSEKEQGGQNAK